MCCRTTVSTASTVDCVDLGLPRLASKLRLRQLCRLRRPRQLSTALTWDCLDWHRSSDCVNWVDCVDLGLLRLASKLQLRQLCRLRLLRSKSREYLEGNRSQLLPKERTWFLGRCPYHKSSRCEHFVQQTPVLQYLRRTHRTPKHLEGL